MRTEKADPGAALWMRVDGAKTGEILAFDNMYGREITGTTEWKKCEIVLDVPKEAAEIDFGALLAGKGTAWVDDLQIEKVDSNVPTTDLTKRGTPIQPLSTQPKNLDFELPPAGNGRPADWGGGPAGYEPGVDQKIVHGGKQSGRIRFVGPERAGGPAFGTLVQGLGAGICFLCTPIFSRQVLPPRGGWRRSCWYRFTQAPNGGQQPILSQGCTWKEDDR